MNPDLERRTLAALHEAGLLRPRPRPIWMAAAALVIGFAAGALAFRAGTTTPEREYLLLLRGSAGAATPAQVQQRVDEYRAWASGISTPISGEKLTDAVTVLGTPAARGDRIGGFFRIETDSLEHAQAIARTCPHLRHGGWIEVREIARGSRSAG